MAILDEFEKSIIPIDSNEAGAWQFIFSGYRLLINRSGGKSGIPKVENLQMLGLNTVRSLYIGNYCGCNCYTAELSDLDCLPEGFVLEDLRTLFPELGNDFFQIALLAVHLIEWDKRCAYCSRCRGELKPCEDMRAKQCILCGMLEFPRISPAVIVLIEKEDEILLARSAQFKDGFFSVIAGFVEPGEGLEDTVHREVLEETGIKVKNIKYFGSQPWPFPDSLMIGFTAEYDSGEIHIDGEEIVEAAWYKADALPKLPGSISIARHLIDWFVIKHSGSVS
jgi:NAD+ diphosphatase